MMTDHDHNGLRNRRSRAPAMGDDDNDESKNATTSDPLLENDDGSEGVASIEPVSKSSSSRPFLLIWIFRIAAVVAFVAGTILRTIFLHTGEECSMTYMMPVFLPVETPRSSSPVIQRYGLYKFVERRDPYYPALKGKQKKQQQPNPQQQMAGPTTSPNIDLLGRGDHCAISNGNGNRAVQNHVVVYVPGHWGTYDQARSLGAHGIGLTTKVEDASVVRNARKRILRAAGMTTDTKLQTSAVDFVYHVYALDFGEQGGALHGKLLDYQSEFLAGVLQQLSEDCGLQKPTDSSGGTEWNSSLTIVAHSMGGTVARRVLVEQQQQQQRRRVLDPGTPTTEFRVQQLITLATPHSNPLYAFDKSVADFYQKWLLPGYIPDDKDQPTASPLVVSIVGGLRDEMIEPEACYLDAPNSKTILATKLMADNAYTAGEEQNPALLGMDHRAIVWCHQLLERVRGILWILIVNTPSLGNPHRLETVTEYLRGDEYVDVAHDQSFARDTAELTNGLMARFGRLSATCMEASMIYNLPCLLALYAVLVALKCAVVALPDGLLRFDPLHKFLLPLASTIVLGSTARRETLGFGTIVIMVLVADSINFCVVYLLTLWHMRRTHRSRIKTNKRSSVRTLWYATGHTLISVTVLLGGTYSGFLLFGSHDQKEFAASYDWFGLLDSILFCGAFVSIYVAVIVGLGSHNDDDRATSASMINAIGNGVSSHSAAFNIQLSAFVILLVPIVVAGPLTLMAWEQHTQASSWWTLFGLQIPVVIWTLVKLMQPRKTAKEKKPQHQLPIRSGLVVLSTLWMCCREPGLLSRGTGYLVPCMAETLLWIDIASSLALQQ